MKIRCGSHQQNRSIVRPGLSLMATKVALTAEEFRENSQRNIALFNTEKLSTNSTHVLKSAYCNSVHFCSCNLHGACGGKDFPSTLPFAHGRLQSARGVWRQSATVTFCPVAIALQSARGVWRQRLIICYSSFRGLLQSARGVWRQSVGAAALSRMPPLQSARGVWRQRNQERMVLPCIRRLQSARGVWRQRRLSDSLLHSGTLLQSARGVWRQSSKVVVSLIVQPCCNLHGACGGKVKRSQERGGKLHVAICTGPAEKPNGIIPRKNPRKFMQTYCIFIHFDV